MSQEQLEQTAARYLRAVKKLHDDSSKRVVDPVALHEKEESSKMLLEFMRVNNLKYFFSKERNEWVEAEQRAGDLSVVAPGVLATLYATFHSRPDILTQLNAMQTMEERGAAFELFVRRSTEGQGELKWCLKPLKSEPVASKLERIAGGSL
jgi:hypothetical protein